MGKYKQKTFNKLFFEMDIFESYKKFKYLDINLEYTNLLDGECKIEINKYGNFYNKSDKIVQLRNYATD